MVDGWMDGCVDRRWMNRCMDGYMDEKMDGWMDGWMDGCVDRRWMNTWMDRKINRLSNKLFTAI